MRMEPDLTIFVSGNFKNKGICTSEIMGVYQIEIEATTNTASETDQVPGQCYPPRKSTLLARRIPAGAFLLPWQG
jgi:hypothetical protein